MRLARPLLVALLLALAAAPAATAHGLGGEVDHRDTPSDLAGADIEHAIALANMARTVAPDLPQFLPTTSCGPRMTSDDAAHAAFSASLRQIKVVYAYASDGPDDSAQWRDALQASVSRIEQFLTLQSGGRRALRVDMGTVCGPQYADIQVVALPNPRAYYLDDFDRVRDGVHAVTGQDTRDNFILADGLTAGGFGVYGTGEVIPDEDRPDAGNPHNAGGFTGIMWTTTTTDPDPAGWQPTVMLHEISHNLGAVQWSAPHTTHPSSDLTGTYSHCWDGEDVMCYEDGPAMVHPYDPNVCPLGSGAIAQTYDCGRDDYYNPAPAPGSYLDTHWNVYNSAFMGSCTQLGKACGDAVVPSPPVNTELPTVSGQTRQGYALTATSGVWLNHPTSFVVAWQRATGADWVTIPGAVGANYLITAADAGAALRAVVTATNEDGSAIVASAPTAPVGEPVAPPVVVVKPKIVTLSLTLRDGRRHAKGTVAARVVPVADGREVRTSAVKVAVTPGTWRLRVCAGPRAGSMRCALSKRVRTRTRTVKLPVTKVLVRTASGPVKITAALVDKHRRIRAQGSAARA